MNIFARFAYSLASPGRYAEMLQGGVGRAVLYLFLLMCVVVAAISVNLYTRIDTGVGELRSAIAKAPDFRLSNGKLVFSGEMPYISEPVAGEVVAIDTTGATGPDLLERYESGFLLTGSAIYTKSRNQGVQTLSWSSFPFETSRDKLAASMPGLTVWIFVIAVVSCLFYAVLAKGISILLLGAVALLAAGSRIAYGKAVGIACYALTGPVLLALLKYFCFPELPFFFPFYWGYAVLFTVAAALHVKNDAASQTLAGQPGAPLG